MIYMTFGLRNKLVVAHERTTSQRRMIQKKNRAQSAKNRIFGEAYLLYDQHKLDEKVSMQVDERGTEAKKKSPSLSHKQLPLLDRDLNLPF